MVVSARTVTYDQQSGNRLANEITTQQGVCRCTLRTASGDSGSGNTIVSPGSIRVGLAQEVLTNFNATVAGLNPLAVDVTSLANGA